MTSPLLSFFVLAGGLLIALLPKLAGGARPDDAVRYDWIRGP